MKKKDGRTDGNTVERKRRGREEKRGEERKVRRNGKRESRTVQDRVTHRAPLTLPARQGRYKRAATHATNGRQQDGKQVLKGLTKATNHRK